MTGLLKPVTALLMSSAILLAGNGLLGVLLPTRAEIEQFEPWMIGLQGSAYFAGLLAGCLFCPRLIGRVGHIRAFVAFTATVTITPLAHALVVSAPAWWGLRVLNGFCFAGLFMGIESWLTASSTAQTRGRLLAAYTIINLTVVTVGMQLVTLYPIESWQLFTLVAILYSLAAVPVALTRTTVPSPPRAARLHLKWLIGVSPAAVIGCLFAGWANSAFWTLSPLYGSSAGLDVAGIALFLSLGVLGGAASQWPVGLLSDRFGRRGLIVAVAALGVAASLGLWLVGTDGPVSPLVLAAAFGAAAFPIYPLCVAHANDLVHPKRSVTVSGGLLLMFSAGAIAGPVVASGIMAVAGPAALFLHTAIAHAIIAAGLLARVQLRPHLPMRRTTGYVVLPRTTPAVFELDPRTPEPEAEATPPPEGAVEVAPATGGLPGTGRRL